MLMTTALKFPSPFSVPKRFNILYLMLPSNVRKKGIFTSAPAPILIPVLEKDDDVLVVPSGKLTLPSPKLLYANQELYMVLQDRGVLYIQRQLQLRGVSEYSQG